MAYNYKVQYIETIKNTVKKSLKSFKIKCDVTIENFYSVIQVKNKIDTDTNDDIFIWIRIIPTKRYESSERYILEISNILLPKRFRRKGVFQALYENLKCCNYVEEVRITSVCTREMLAWCNKNMLKEYDIGCYR